MLLLLLSPPPLLVLHNYSPLSLLGNSHRSVEEENKVNNGELKGSSSILGFHLQQLLRILSQNSL